MNADSVPPTARAQRGICVRGDEICYLCEQPVRDGDAAVSYDDDAFWEQQFFYHASCWSEAELAAKDFGGESIHEGVAMVLPSVKSARCSEAVEVGEAIVRVRGGETAAGGVSVLPRILHLDCFEAGEA